MDEKFNKTTYINSGSEFIIQIDIRNQKHLTEIGQLVMKKDARALHQFANGMLFYLSRQKLS